ncbi:MAG: hypothetical protein SOZ27_02440 [Spirochaetia bacterium]|nr:hypothetical protein [Spirochaetia bacterium]
MTESSEPGVELSRHRRDIRNKSLLPRSAKTESVISNETGTHLSGNPLTETVISPRQTPAAIVYGTSIPIQNDLISCLTTSTRF